MFISVFLGWGKGRGICEENMLYGESMLCEENMLYGESMLCEESMSYGKRMLYGKRRKGIQSADMKTF